MNFRLRRLQVQMYMKACVLFALLVCIPAYADAQATTYPEAFGFQVHRGFIFQHKPDMEQLVTGHVSGLEMLYERQFMGNKPWQHFYHFPYAGISLQYFDFHNQLLGKAFALNPYISFPLKRSNRLQWHFRLSTGLGYFTQAFDLHENRKNGLIGSHLTGSVQFLMQLRWRILPRLELSGGVSMEHFSNGAWKIPNAGINFPGAQLGLSYAPGALKPMQLQSFPVIPSGWWFLIWTGWFGKETDPVLSGKYLAGTLSFNALRRYSAKASYGAGLDLMADWTLYKRRKTGQPSFPMRNALALLYEIHLGKWSIPLQLGFYVYDPYRFDTPFYQRIGWRYRVNRNLLLNISLKAHLSRADYLEFGFGYLFGKRS